MPEGRVEGATTFHGGSIAIGAIGCGRETGTLRTFLGSCVGLALYDPRLRVAALAHIVLPDSRGEGTPPGKYADTAIPEAIDLLRSLADGAKLRLSAKIAGGAKMFAFQTSPSIGEQNVLAVEERLSMLDIPILGRSCGGDKGRRMTVDIASGAVTVEMMGMPEQRL